MKNLYLLVFHFSFLIVTVWYCGVVFAQPKMECNLTMPKELVFDSKIGDYVPNPFTVHSTLINKIDSIPTSCTISWNSLYIKFKDNMGEDFLLKAMPITQAALIEICITYRVKNMAPIICCDSIRIPAAISTDVDSKKNNPTSFYLGQNYPNPFTQTTTIKLPLLVGEGRVEDSQWRGEVFFKVYDIFGREVLDLSKQVIGNLSLIISNSQLPSPGIYFYRLTVGNESQTRMMTLIK